MAKSLTDNWQIAENLTDYWHLRVIFAATRLSVKFRQWFYWKIRVYHIRSMISNLRSSEWLLRMTVLQRQLQVFTEMIQGRFFLVVLRSTSQYYTRQLFLSQIREIFTLSWPRFPETSRRLPKISDEFPRTSERCRKLKKFKHFWGYLKGDTFSVLWYDFVRTQKGLKVFMC